MMTQTTHITFDEPVTLQNGDELIEEFTTDTQGIVMSITVSVRRVDGSIEPISVTPA